MTVWQYYSLEMPKRDQWPVMDQLAVVRLGSVSFPKHADYYLGTFRQEKLSPKASKIWFYRQGGGISDPAQWNKYHTDVRYTVIDTPEGGVGDV